MNKIKVVALLGVALGVVLAGLAYFEPITPGGISGTVFGQRLTLMVASLYLVLSIEAVVLFWAGLKGFKGGLRKAYLILCAAIIMFAIAQIQVPVTTITGLEWWTTTGLVALPYVLSSFLAYWALRTFAQAVGIKDALTKFRFVLPAIFALIAVSFFLPVHLSSIMPTAVAHHTFTAIVIWELVLDGLAGWNAWRIRQTMGGTYQSAMTWLFVAFFSYTLTHLHFAVLQATGYDNWYGRNSLETVPLAVVGLLLVKAGYEFWKVTAPVRAAKSSSPLDVVIYAASLATNRGAINPIMDTVRQVSAGMTPGGSLSAQNQEALAQVYLKLEAYLVEKEPLRTFTREDLRGRIERKFPHEASQGSAFWGKLA
ncbi:MAG: hypothetical protein JWN01_586 [Patescibacteria group bacterium]|nr:hypothetical protein [Patescibacteria group bacterium]